MAPIEDGRVPLPRTIAAREDAAPPRVLVYDPSGADAATLDGIVRRSDPQVAVIAMRTNELPAADAATLDVALLSLGEERFHGLEIGAELAAHWPWVETVFWYDHRSGGPAAAAARSLGVERVVPLARLAGWLQLALRPLARLARARRDLLDARAALPPLPSPEDDGGTALALPEAERRFRETYLRRLLSGSATYRLAARRAGVPYTTLCSMLKKLDIG